MNGIGRVESGTEIESHAGAVAYSDVGEERKQDAEALPKSSNRHRFKAVLDKA